MQFCSLFLVFAPHKKRAVARSQTQGLSQLAAGIKSLAESQASCHKKEMEENRRRDEMFFQFQREQRELDRQHESRMMQLIMTMQQQQKQLLISPPAPLAPQDRYNNAASTLPSRHFQDLLPPPPTSPPMSPVYQNFRHHQMPVSSPPVFLEC